METNEKGHMQPALKLKKFIKSMLMTSAIMITFGISIGCNVIGIQSSINYGHLGVDSIDLCLQALQITFLGIAFLWLGIGIITATILLYGASIIMQCHIATDSK